MTGPTSKMAEELLCLQQGGRPLEQYEEEFVEFSHLCPVTSPVPVQSPVTAPAPDQSPEMAPAPDQISERTLSPVPSPEKTASVVQSPEDSRPRAAWPPELSAPPWSPELLAPPWGLPGQQALTLLTCM